MVNKRSINSTFSSIIYFLLSPYILSFVIMILLITFHPFKVEKYVIEDLGYESVKPNEDFYYQDLDNDSISETILLIHGAYSNTSVIVYDNNSIVYQWLIKGQIHRHRNIYFDDLNNDTIIEIIIFTQDTSSGEVFLSIINPYSKQTVVKERKVANIDHIVEKNPNEVLYICSYDLHGDNYNELFFIISSGYNLQPRNVFRYDFRQDSLIISPKSYAPIYSFNLCDLNEDGNPELYISTAAYENSTKDVPYSDHQSFLFGFDLNLNEIFTPIILGHYSSYALLSRNNSNTGEIGSSYFYCDPLRIDNNLPTFGSFQNHLYISFLNITSNELDSNYIAHVNFKGKLDNVKSIQQNSISQLIISSRDQAYNYIHFEGNNNFMVYDRLNNLCDSIPFCSFFEGNCASLDLNADGSTEYIFQNDIDNGFIIATEDLTSHITFVTKDASQFHHLNLIRNKNDTPVLLIQTKTTKYQLKYLENPFYPFRHSLYLGIYLLFSLIIILVQKIQDIRRKYKIREAEQISGLQIKVLKSQIDSHFTLNTIDAIGNLYSSGDRKTGNYYLGKYSKLLREATLKTDSFAVELLGDIEFIENYLELQQFKFNNRFAFQVTYQPDELKDYLIPKMYIQIFVENALKYGLNNKTIQPEISLTVSMHDASLIIEVADNGYFLERNQESSGLGFGLIKRMETHFNDHHPFKIRHTLNVFTNGEYGTLVSIILSKSPSKIRKKSPR